MDDILTEEDFDDFAAAVGEGGDGGSEDDARVRDYPSCDALKYTAVNTKVQ